MQVITSLQASHSSNIIHLSSGSLAEAAVPRRPHLPRQAQPIPPLWMQGKVDVLSTRTTGKPWQTAKKDGILFRETLLKSACSYEMVHLNLLLDSPNFYSTLSLTIFVRWHFSLLIWISPDTQESFKSLTCSVGLHTTWC